LERIKNFGKKQRYLCNIYFSLSKGGGVRVAWDGLAFFSAQNLLNYWYILKACVPVHAHSNQVENR